MRRAVPGKGLPLLLTAVVLALTASAARAGTLVFDPFTDSFPPNPCIQDVERHVVYDGLFCPGSCPPDSFRTTWCGSNTVNMGINWTLPGMALDPDQHFSRWATMQANSPDGASGASAELAPGDPRIDVHTTSPRGSVLYMGYSSPDAWTIDLASHGVTALRIPLTGDVSAEQPLVCVTWMGSLGATGGHATCTARATAEGDLVLPFSHFVTEPGFDLAYFRTLNLTFEDCESGYCPGTVPARHYRIGAPRFDTGAATPAVRRTWGALKAAYR